MNKNISSQCILKFLSILFNPHKYSTLSKEQIQKIANGIFKEHKDFSKNILDEFAFANSNYYIKVDSYFSPEQLLQVIIETINTWKENDYWILLVCYNSYQDSLEFQNLLLQNNKLFFLKKRKQNIINMIKKLPYEFWLNNYSRVPLENINNSNKNFTKLLRSFDSVIYTPAINKCLFDFISNVVLLNIFSWNYLIDVFPDNFSKLVYNQQYLSLMNKESQDVKKKDLKFCKERNILLFSNAFYFVNKQKKIIDAPFNILKMLSLSQQFYYIGIILANYESWINRDLCQEAKEKIYEYLFSLLQFRVNKRMFKCLQLGIENSNPFLFRPIIVDIYNKVLLKNEQVAKILAEIIITDFEKTLVSESIHLPQNSKEFISYTNAIINAALVLYKTKRKIYQKFLCWNESFQINYHDFDFSDSFIISNKAKALFLYSIELFILSNLKLNNIILSKRIINRTINSYLQWLNLFQDVITIDDNSYNLIYSTFNLIELRNVIKKEIMQLCQLNHPNLKLLALLISIDNNNIEAISFIASYFNAYKTYFDDNKIEKWATIWLLLKNKQNFDFCLTKLPEWKKDYYREKLDCLSR